MNSPNALTAFPDGVVVSEQQNDQVQTEQYRMKITLHSTQTHKSGTTPPLYGQRNLEVIVDIPCAQKNHQIIIIIILK